MFFHRLIILLLLFLSPTFANAMKADTAMIITSSAFEHGGEIPQEYTCQGKDISPPLSWKNIPEAAKSLVLIVEDPDAPDPKAPKMVWIHWILYNLAPKSTELPKNAQMADLPLNTIPGITSFKTHQYGGPCPPIGKHRYFFRLYALNTQLPALEYPTVESVKSAMQGHVIAEAVLMGTYQK